MDENPNERLLFLSDGVIAVAITLLVLDIRLPEAFGHFSDAQLWDALVELWPRFLAYFISFAVIGTYWLSHQGKFAHIVKADRGLAQINILFLLTIGLVPFTTSLIAENDGALATAIYAGTMVVSGLALSWLWFHADSKGLIDPAYPVEERRRVLVTTLLSSAVFAISVPLAFANPDGAKYFWLLLVPINFFARGLLSWTRKLGASK